MRKDRGFTLIEVLVALVVFAVGVLATLRAMGVAIGGADEQKVRLLARVGRREPAGGDARDQSILSHRQ